MKYSMFILWLWAVTTLTAATPDDRAIPLLKKATDQFMSDVCRDELKRAFEWFMTEWWVQPDKAESVTASFLAQIQAQGSWLKEEGKLQPERFEFLEGTRLGNRVVRLMYLAKGENAPVPCCFQFYKAARGWRLNQILLGGAQASDMVHNLGEATLDVNAANEVQMKSAVDNFLEKLIGDGASLAVSNLVESYGRDAEGKSQFIEDLDVQLLKYLRSAREILGPLCPNATEFIGAIHTGKDCVRFVYLQHYEGNWLPWEFYFYRGRSEWRLNQIAFSWPNEQTARDLRRLAVPEPSTE